VAAGRGGRLRRLAPQPPCISGGINGRQSTLRQPTSALLRIRRRQENNGLAAAFRAAPSLSCCRAQSKASQQCAGTDAAWARRGTEVSVHKREMAAPCPIGRAAQRTNVVLPAPTARSMLRAGASEVRAGLRHPARLVGALGWRANAAASAPRRTTSEPRQAIGAGPLSDAPRRTTSEPRQAIGAGPLADRRRHAQNALRHTQRISTIGPVWSVTSRTLGAKAPMQRSWVFRIGTAKSEV